MNPDAEPDPEQPVKLSAPLNVRLSPPLRKAIQERADELGLDVSETLRHIVAVYFEGLRR